MLEKFSSVFSTVLSNKDIVQTHWYSIPSTWERMIDVVNKRKEIVVNISQFKGYNDLIRKEKEANDQQGTLGTSCKNLCTELIDLMSNEKLSFVSTDFTKDFDLLKVSNTLEETQDKEADVSSSVEGKQTSAANTFVTKPQVEERTQGFQEASGVKVPEKDIFSSPVGMVLQYLAAIGEIFIFPDNQGLNDKCIIKPLAFIHELR